ncbi:MAG: glutathione S-transferase N-terminal domain-containing protein [Acidiferrobacterales bacterium]|nr:glutathione S-transferase N-terminal domain-containing protein [Acidiferrobacterales bacterium]
MSSNIQLYTWGTPNGRKISIALEEMGASYDVQSVNILEGEQFSESFTAISPSSKIPCIVDPEGMHGQSTSIFESGAILIYLARKFGRFGGSDPASELEILQWVMWQMGNVGPVLGQLHHFRKFSKTKVPYAIKRFDNIADKLYRVLDSRLASRNYVVDDYSIADMAIYPWAARFEWQNIDLRTYPNVKRWFDMLSERPAVNTGMRVPFLN